MRKKIFYYLFYFVFAALIVQSCTPQYFRSNYHDANELLQETAGLKEKPYLKAHLRDGDLYVLWDSWQLDTTQGLLLGEGDQYNVYRKKVYQGKVTIPLDSVVIFETNTPLKDIHNEEVTISTLIFALNVVGAIACLVNPKACFGSCPTFYTNESDNVHYASAEGFSNAISPSMEDSDIDALGRWEIADSIFSIKMKNEALETHYVKNVHLRACPLKDQERVYQSPSDKFYLCESIYLPSLAEAAEGDITSLLKAEDKQERFSLADEKNLSSKEEIFLTFEGVEDAKNLGLVLSFRQMLMTTYFIYSALDYMGDEAGYIFAEIERGSDLKDKLKSGLKAELGDIDVYFWSEKKTEWVFQGSFYETGPIAINQQFIPLCSIDSHHFDKQLKLKLVLNKGLWRIDYLALTRLKAEVIPQEIPVQRVVRQGSFDEEALKRLRNSNQYLVTMPGDEYEFHFALPEKNGNRTYELFLYSKGYYLEWMRDEWVQDKDLRKLKQMIDKPKKYLKSEAKAYKLYEQEMEDVFWGSRIKTKNFSYENF